MAGGVSRQKGDGGGGWCVCVFAFGLFFNLTTASSANRPLFMKKKPLQPLDLPASKHFAPHPPSPHAQSQHPTLSRNANIKTKTSPSALTMANALRVVLLCATFTLLTGGVLGDDGFDLSDALSDDLTTKPPPAKPRNPSGGKDTGDFDYSDFLDFDTPSDKQTTTKAPRRTPTTKPSKRASGDDDFSLLEFLPTTPSPRKTTKSPKTPKKPQKGNSDPNEFKLSDALDDSNDNAGKRGKDDSDHPSVPGSKGNDKPKGGKQTDRASDISDKDLEDLLDGGYKPDGKKQGDNIPSDDQDQVGMPETTIAGIASAVAATLLGVVSSYIAYQKKQLCFKIQESMNVKGANAEAGAMTAPQGII
ncbi:CD99 antigen-like protein 2 isoform X2 [Scyliorhinus canicula]|uniref:CD99 antigen-like protein 2 isoform X2 n=1 Tax=Scyliorhinus canicula TaxID=7830 RepID=UPI0018F3A548|nr:CD99 antigen-like protein 2 isoform X2 [Scyliorhinus canicula]